MNVTDVINLTPHNINIMDDDNRIILIIEPEEQVARIAATTGRVGIINHSGEVEIPVDIEAYVTAEHDGYATGDSPTLYEVKLQSVIIRDPEGYYRYASGNYGDGVDIVDKLDPSDIEEFEELAIKEVQ